MIHQRRCTVVVVVIIIIIIIIIISGKHDVKKLQNTVTLSTARTQFGEYQRKSTKRLIIENIIKCTINFNHKIAVKLYALEFFCYKFVNVLHKDDKQW